MAKVDGVDVRGLSDGLLLTRRSAYERETSWAPASITDELRVIRLTELAGPHRGGTVRRGRGGSEAAGR